MNEQACWDYINQNMWNVNPVTEEEFRASGFATVYQVGPCISGNVYLVGLREEGNVGGFFDPQRQAGATSPV
jgi:hypothetical protein